MVKNGTASEYSNIFICLLQKNSTRHEVPQSAKVEPESRYKYRKKGGLAAMLHVILGLASFGFFAFLVMSIHAAIKKRDKLLKRAIFTVVFFIIAFVLGRLLANGYNLPEGKSNGPLIVLLIVIALLYFLINERYKVAKTQKSLGAFSNYAGIHMYGIPLIPEMSRANLYITTDKLIVERKKLRFELPLIHIRGAEAVSKDMLSNVRSSIYWEGVREGAKLKPWEVVGGGAQAIAKHNMKGTYLAIDYVTASGEVKLLIFNLMNLSKAKQAANSLSLHLRQFG
ncbi:hypothetical protein D3C78_1127270 [compost metagenome]